MFNKDSNQELKPSSQPVKGRINYTFQNGLNAFQEQLNLGQDMELSQIALKLDLNASSFSNMKSFVETLIREKAVVSILKIILTPNIKAEDNSIPEEMLLSLKNDELENILMDFFSLNPKPVSWLKTIAEEAITLLTTHSSKNTVST